MAQLRLSGAHGACEQGADRVAEQVMRLPADSGKEDDEKAKG